MLKAQPPAIRIFLKITLRILIFYYKILCLHPRRQNFNYNLQVMSELDEERSLNDMHRTNHEKWVQRVVELEKEKQAMAKVFRPFCTIFCVLYKCSN